MKRRAALVVAAVFAVLTLAGCDRPPDNHQGYGSYYDPPQALTITRCAAWYDLWYQNLENGQRQVRTDGMAWSQTDGTCSQEWPAPYPTSPAGLVEVMVVIYRDGAICNPDEFHYTPNIYGAGSVVPGSCVGLAGTYTARIYLHYRQWQSGVGYSFVTYVVTPSNTLVLS